MDDRRRSSAPHQPASSHHREGSHSHHHSRRYSHNEDIEVIDAHHIPKTIPAIWKRKMVTWFSRWDADDDGLLTIRDFELLADRLGETCSKPVKKERLRYLFIYLWEHFVSPEGGANAGIVTQEEWIDHHYKARLKWDKNPTMTATLIATFGLLFDAIDTEDTGSLSMDEYRAFYSIMGLSESLADEAFYRMDKNSDGRLSREEFLDTVMAYYCELEPSAAELQHSLFLGPLVETTDVNQDLLLNWSSAS